MSVSVVIVSFNTRELLEQCLASVCPQVARAEGEVIVVDNASSDGSAAMVRQRFPEVVLIENDRNLGFGRACNQAAERAGGKWILLLNPDARLLPGTLESMIDFAEDHPKHALFGGRTLTVEGQLDPVCTRRRMTVWSLLCKAVGLSSALRNTPLFNPEEMPDWDRRTVREVDIVSGCFMLVRSDLWAELQGFDPRFYMYGEDDDLCMRAGNAGQRPLFNPKASVVHVRAASDSIRHEKIGRLLAAQVLVLQKHWPAYRVAVGKALLWLWVLRHVVSGRVLSVLKGESSSRDWEAAWRRRAEWLRGRWPAPTGSGASQRT